MTQAQQQVVDPFEQGQGVPSISFKDAPFGSIITIAVDDDAKWLQSRDYETGELDYWDARPGETPNPKMAAVVTGVVQDTPWARQQGIVGERRSIWAGKPSNLFTAIQNAKRQVGPGTQITPGGVIDVAFTGEEPNQKNPRLNNIKLYQARYTPAPPGYGVADAFEQAGLLLGQQLPPQFQPPAQPQQQGFAQQPQQQGFAQQPQQGQPFQPPAQPQQQGFAQQPQQGQPSQPPAQQQVPAAAQPQQFQPPAQQQVPAAAQQYAQQPQGQPFGQPQQPQQAQQPAMAGAPAPTDPWSTAPSSDVPNF